MSKTNNKTTTNTNLKISPEVIRMLGRKLYSSHPLPIVVRELLQNSIDACKRYDVTPQIDISIDIDTEDKMINVTCKDNGEGMTEDILLNKFLCLGESGKRDDKGGTGGFGIAKAAIMSNIFWSVHSHDMYIDVNMLGEPLAEVDYLDGTEVKVGIDEKWYESTIKETLAMIYGSDVSIRLRLTAAGNVIIDDSMAGLQKTTVKDYTDHSDRYDISLFNSWNPHNDKYTKFSGLCLYRINGLVQFIQTGYGFNPNAVVELYSDLLPTDNDYPLSMSRENIQSDLRWVIRSRISNYAENALTTSSKITNAEREENKTTNRGALGKGKVKSGRTPVNLDRIIAQQKDLEMMVEFLKKSSNKFAEEAKKIEEVREISSDDISLEASFDSDIAQKIKRFVQLENLPAIGKLQSMVIYRDDKPTTEEKRILRLWAGILILTANPDDEFAVGITGLETEGASRYTADDGTVYYLLNTGKILEENHQMDALIHRLHMLAAHECMHYNQSSHNEYFTSGMDDVYTDSIAMILDNMPKLRSIIRNNYK